MLLDKRKEIGARTSKLPFNILPNDALRSLAEHPVKTIEEFQAVQGIGQARAELYFPDFLAVMEQYEMLKADPDAFGVDALDTGADNQSTPAEDFDWDAGDGAAAARSIFAGGGSSDRPYTVESESDDDFDSDSARKKLKT